MPKVSGARIKLPPIYITKAVDKSPCKVRKARHRQCVDKLGAEVMFKLISAYNPSCLEYFPTSVACLRIGFLQLYLFRNALEQTIKQGSVDAVIRSVNPRVWSISSGLPCSLC